MTLYAVPNPEDELLELTCAIEAFHDVYAPQLPYFVVAALQKTIGYEGLERCAKCFMRKYTVKDHLCIDCRKL